MSKTQSTMQRRWRSKYWIRKAGAVGDPLVAALFGAARVQEGLL